jgi:hypothetical protein
MRQAPASRPITNAALAGKSANRIPTARPPSTVTILHHQSSQILFVLHVVSGEKRGQLFASFSPLCRAKR